jgi:hypothetical protein
MSAVEAGEYEKEVHVDIQRNRMSMPNSNSRSFTIPRVLQITTLVLFSCLFLVSSSIRTIVTAPATPQSADARHWAQYSPYYPVDQYLSLPRGCKVAQVSNLVKGPHII